MFFRDEVVGIMPTALLPLGSIPTAGKTTLSICTVSFHSQSDWKTK